MRISWINSLLMKMRVINTVVDHSVYFRCTYTHHIIIVIHKLYNILHHVAHWSHQERHIKRRYAICIIYYCVYILIILLSSWYILYHCVISVSDIFSHLYFSRAKRTFCFLQFFFPSSYMYATYTCS